MLCLHVSEFLTTFQCFKTCCPIYLLLKLPHIVFLGCSEVQDRTAVQMVVES